MKYLLQCNVTRKWHNFLCFNFYFSLLFEFIDSDIIKRFLANFVFVTVLYMKPTGYLSFIRFVLVANTKVIYLMIIWLKRLLYLWIFNIQAMDNRRDMAWICPLFSFYSLDWEISTGTWNIMFFLCRHLIYVNYYRTYHDADMEFMSGSMHVINIQSPWIVVDLPGARCISGWLRKWQWLLWSNAKLCNLRFPIPQ